MNPTALSVVSPEGLTSRTLAQRGPAQTDGFLPTTDPLPASWPENRRPIFQAYRGSLPGSCRPIAGQAAPNQAATILMWLKAYPVREVGSGGQSGNGLTHPSESHPQPHGCPRGSLFSGLHPLTLF